MERSLEAYEAFTTAVDLGAHDPLIHLHLGDVSMSLDRATEAKMHFKTLIRRAPSFGPGYLRLCEACLSLGQLEEAKAAFAVAYLYGPRQPDVLAMADQLKILAP